MVLGKFILILFVPILLPGYVYAKHFFGEDWREGFKEYWEGIVGR